MKKTGYPSPFENPEILDKAKNTCLKKYGVEYPFQNNEIVKKSQKTHKNRYGGLMVNARKKLEEIYRGLNPFEIEEIKQKCRATIMKKYGKTFYSQTQEGKDKVKKTMNERFGRDNMAQINMPDNVYNFLKNKERFCSTVRGRTVIDVANEIGTTNSAIILKYARLYNVIDTMIFEPPSAMEETLVRFLTEKGIAFTRRNRKITGDGKEIDIVIEDAKLCIELHGVDIHSEIYGKKTRNYHYNKYRNCKNAGYRLLQFFSSDFWKNLNIIKNMILNAVGYKMPTIGARKCIIDKVDIDSESEFLEKNHLQGFAAYRKFSYGAYYNNELVGVISFSQKGEIGNLVRFCTKIGNRYPGLFSKMLKHVIKNHPDITKIITFSDNMVSNGDLYKKCGFIESGKVAPDYYYTQDYQKLYNKQGFRKNKLMEKIGLTQEEVNTLTEWEIVQSMGYDRIWDSGKIKWTLDINCQ